MLAHSVWLLAGLALRGQVQHGGSAYPLSALHPNLLDLADSAPDVDSLLAQDDDAAQSHQRRRKSLRVGALVGARASLRNFSSVETAAGGKLFRLEVTSPGALGLGLNLRRFHLPAGAKMFVYRSDGSDIHGAFTAANHKSYGGLSIVPTKGDAAIIELFVPAGTDPMAASLELESVVHHYRDALFAQRCVGYGCAGECTVNVACPPGAGWRDQAAGVVQVLTSDGTTLCSAAMVNNLASDGRQLMLTASHCDQDPVGSAEDWIVLFGYQSPSCDNVPTEPSRNRTAQGTKLLARRGEFHRHPSDFALLELTEAIPDEYGVWLNGFDASEAESFSRPFGIDHPRGDVKKLHARDGNASVSGFFLPGTSHWLVDRWDVGTTEQGSSGSPLFDAAQRIRGQLNGGLSTCEDPVEDYYGRLAVSWELHSHERRGADPDGDVLQPWLDPMGTARRVCNGTWLTDARASAAQGIL